MNNKKITYERIQFDILDFLFHNLLVIKPCIEKIDIDTTLTTGIGLIPIYLFEDDTINKKMGDIILHQIKRDYYEQLLFDMDLVIEEML